MGVLRGYGRPGLKRKQKRDVTVKKEDKKTDGERYCKVSGINRKEDKERERAGSTTRCSDFDTRGKEGQKEQKNEQEEI